MYDILSLVSCCELENKFYDMKEKTPVSVYIIIILCILGVLMMFLALFSDVLGEMAEFFLIGGIILVLPYVGFFLLFLLVDQLRGK